MKKKALMTISLGLLESVKVPFSTASFFNIRHSNNGLIGCKTLTLKTTFQTGSSSMLNRTQLMKIKCKAIRAGVWFRALPRIDRVLVDLTIKVAENIRSARLVKCILAVMSKLEGLLESSFLRSIRAIGRSLAEKNSLIAQKWGNVSAKAWAVDSSFACFLGIMHSNK